MKKIRQPDDVRNRSHEIADLINDACEKLVELSSEWSELNDAEGAADAQRMLSSREVTLLVTARVEKGLGCVGIHLLRTDAPLPKPYFEIRVPMSPWTLGTTPIAFDEPAYLSPRRRPSGS